MNEQSARRLPRFFLGIALGFLLCLDSSAHATMHPRFGEPLGEPTTTGTGVHLLREDLKFDLRGGGHLGRMTVHARYRIRNDGPMQTFRFTLPPGGRTAASVLVGGQDAVAVTPGSRRERRLLNPDSGPSFELAVASGVHAIEVSYEATADVLPIGEVRGLAVNYEFSGASTWASVGTLAVEVLVPEGWRFAEQSPFLKRVADDRYEAAFEAYPRAAGHRPEANDSKLQPHVDPSALSIVVRPPLTVHYLLWMVQVFAHLAALSLPFFFVRRLRRRWASREERVPLARKVGSAVVCTALVGLLPTSGLVLHAAAYPHLANVQHMLLLLAITWTAGSFICWFAHLSRADGVARER